MFYSFYFIFSINFSSSKSISIAKNKTSFSFIKSPRISNWFLMFEVFKDKAKNTFLGCYFSFCAINGKSILNPESL